MITIKIRFLTGRYHATAFGRNVNEGIPEWPPSPYRLVRALIDVAKRRFPMRSEAELLDVLRLLQRPPKVFVPEVRMSHTRYFMVTGKDEKTNRDKLHKIFDPFVVIDPKKAVYFVYEPESESPQSIEYLNELLSHLPYLGRAESWIEAGLTDLDPDKMGLDAFIPDKINQDTVSQQVLVACVLPEREYRPFVPPKLKKNQVQAPLTWFQALCFNTTNMVKYQVNTHPAMQFVTYQKDSVVKQSYSKGKAMLINKFRLVKYAMDSPVLPRITKTLAIAEQIRVRLMGINKIQTDASHISPKFSGKDVHGNPDQGHNHVFILPVDENGDGYLDHVYIQSTTPFDTTELEVLDRLKLLYQSKHRPDIRLILESLQTEPQWQQATHWVSVTPFVTARHYRKGRGSITQWLQTEIQRECRLRGLPEPHQILPVTETKTNPPVKWFEFIRSRKNSRPMYGTGWRLIFDEPVKGPFALGALSHFGLGLFMPDKLK